MQLNLLTAIDLPGLALFPDAVSEAEERDLIALVDSADLKPFRFRGWTGSRLVSAYGLRFDHEHQRLEQGPDIPRELILLRDRLARSVGLQPDALVQALLTRYDPGAGINWHRDRPEYEKIIGLSLGSRSVLRLRKKTPDGAFKRTQVPLEPREAYLLSGEARRVWEHSIKPGATKRWSVTFRSLTRP